MKESPEELKQISWVDRAQYFARVRAQIRQILHKSDKPLHMGEICYLFIEIYRYLPKCVERRLYELVKTGDIQCNDGTIPTYEFVRQ